jgi:hypothetical protein
MGRYIDWGEVAGRYPKVAQIAGDTSLGSYWLQYAEYEIDGYLAQRYTTPFTPENQIVNDLCIDLTYYKMTMAQETSKPLWEYIKYRLDAIIAGTMVLVDVPPSTALGAVAWSEGAGYSTSFGPDDPVNWAVSSEWMQDVADSRE